MSMYVCIKFPKGEFYYVIKNEYTYVIKNEYMKVIGCSSLRGGGGELGTLKT